MQLKDLLPTIAQHPVQGDWHCQIRGLAYDSRTVKPGYLFISLGGDKTSGDRYIAQAIAQGASAIISAAPAPANLQAEICWVQQPTSRVLLAEIAARFYHHPDRELKLIGITGTNGKTTLTYLMEAILNHAKIPTGVIGTIQYRYPGFVQEAQRTTPEALDLIRLQRHMVDQGVQALAMEVSSHALAQQRTHLQNFDVAIVTNITQDHLDYHGDMAGYIKAKALLFASLELSCKHHPVAVINGDDPNCAPILHTVMQRLPKRFLTFGYAHNCSVRPVQVAFAHNGLHATIALQKLDGTREELNIQSSLVGRHNLMNILAAVAASHALGIATTSIASGIAKLTHVPGRLECISTSLGTTIYIDYAHTDDALVNVLQALHTIRREGQHGQGRIITVFGCGGDRDKLKRPQMGLAVLGLTDIAVITSDNPRNEDPMQIIADITATPEMTRAFCHPTQLSQIQHYPCATIMADRREAILTAMQLAKSNDLILIAGKGHEQTQEIRGIKHPFSDREVTLQLMEKMGWTLASA